MNYFFEHKIWELPEKLACRFLIWRFNKGYGAGNCDIEDEYVKLPAGCPSCQAGRCNEFLRQHIELLK